MEETIRATGAAEVPSQEVGLAILGPLSALDEVAYLRFASVYRSFESAADFAAEIDRLKADRPVDESGSTSTSDPSDAKSPDPDRDPVPAPSG